MLELAFLFVTSGPVPKHLVGPEAAPAPRVMYPYVEDGKTKYYSREYFDESGVRRRRIREGDPEFESRGRPAVVGPDGKIHEN